MAGGEFGTNLPGTTPADYAFPTDAQFAYIASKGFLVCRLPVKWERCVNGTPGGALDTAYMALVDAAVASCLSRGVRVILDLHNYHRFKLAGTERIIGSAQVTQAHFVDVWQKLAVRYQADNRVWFGLMNEPHDVAGGAAAVFADQQAVLNAIRAAGVGNKVLLSGTEWTGAATWGSSGNGAAALGVTDPANNFAFDVHSYLDVDGTGTHNACAVGTGAMAGDWVFRLQPAVSWAEANGKSLFVGEGAWDPGNSTCLSWYAAGLSYLRSKAPGTVLGFTYWGMYPAAYGNPDSNPKLLNPIGGTTDRAQIAELQAYF